MSPEHARILRRLAAVARIALGAIFIYAAVPKLADPEAFFAIVLRYPLGIAQIALPVTALLPPFELVLGLALVSGLWRRGALAWAGALLSLFLVALVYAAASGVDIACGCFAQEPAQSVIDTAAILRDAAFLGLALVAALGERGAA